MINFVSTEKTYITVAHPQCIFEWILENHKADKFFDPEAKSATKAIKDFQEALLHASKEFPKVFKDKITIFDMFSDISTFFFSFIEKYVQLVEINLPDKTRFMESWNEFRCDIAYLRYRSDPDIFKRVTEFLSYLNKQSQKIDQLQEQTEKSNLYWEMWQQIFQHPDLLDVELPLLLEKTIPDLRDNQPILYFSSPIHIKLLQKVISLKIGTLLKDASWTISEMEKITLKNQAVPCHPILNNFPLQLEGIDFLRKTFLPQLAQIGLRNLKKLDFMFDRVTDLCVRVNLLTGLFGQSIGSIPFGNNTNLTMSLETILEIIEKEKQHPEYVYDLDTYFDKLDRIKKDFTIGKMTLAELKDYLQALHNQQKCHILINTYILKTFAQFAATKEGMLIWFQKYSQNKLLGKCISAINKQNLSSLTIEANTLIRPQTTDKRSLDEIKEYISPTQKTVGKKGGQKIEPKPTVNEAPKKPVLINNNSPIVPLEKPKLVQPQTPFLQLYGRVAKKINLLINRYHNTDLQLLCRPLTQSLMHLHDITVTYKRLQSHSVLNAIQTVASTYYHMEQLIRFQRMIKKDPFDPLFLCHKHNLKKLLKPLTLTIDTSISKLLYLGNFWSFHTYEQLAGWSKLESQSQQKMPEPLTIIEKTLASTKYSDNVSLLKKYLEDSIIFSNSLLEEPIVESTFFESNPVFFQHQQKFAKEAFADKCQRLITVLEAYNTEPAILKLKQASQNLKILNEILSLLNNPKVESHTFCQLVRGAIYWENGILEKLLQALYFLKTGIDTKEHNLSHLWNSKSDILDQWALANNFCRYPFEYQTPCSQLHELILQAEILRTNPDFDAGYKLNFNNPHFGCVNYIPVPLENLNANELLQKLNKILNQASTFITKQLIPELDKIAQSFANPTTS